MNGSQLDVIMQYYYCLNDKDLQLGFEGRVKRISEKIKKRS